MTKLYKHIAIISLLGSISSAYADWQVSPSVKLDTRYDDNMRSQPDNEESGTQSNLGVQARLRNKQEDSDVTVLAGANVVKYSGIDGLDYSGVDHTLSEFTVSFVEKNLASQKNVFF